MKIAPSKVFFRRQLTLDLVRATLALSMEETLPLIEENPDLQDRTAQILKQIRLCHGRLSRPVEITKKKDEWYSRKIEEMRAILRSAWDSDTVPTVEVISALLALVDDVAEQIPTVRPHLIDQKAEWVRMLELIQSLYELHDPDLALDIAGAKGGDVAERFKEVIW